MKQRLFWSILALSSIAAAVFGYHRFRQVRPDVFQDPAATRAAEQQRLERIEAYQERARSQAWGRAQPESGSLGPNQRCVDGFLIEVRASAEGSAVTRIEHDGQPVPCDID